MSRAVLTTTAASLVLSACGVALVAAVEDANGAARASHRGAPSGEKVTTLRFTQVQTSEHFIDQPPAGPGPGDMDVITTNLLSGGKVVGHGRIVGTAVDFPNIEFIRTDELPRGHISSLDTHTEGAKTENVAIVGGTGAYRDARGFITLTNTSATQVRVVYTIITS